MKKLLMVLSMVGVASFALSAYADDFKVGVVDVREVLQKSPQVAVQQDKIKKQFADRQKQIVQAQQQLQTDANKLNKDGAVMAPADKTALMQKAQGEEDNLRNLQASFQKDLYAQQAQAMQQILNQLQTAAAKVGKDKGLTLVVTKDAVLYSTNETDITSDVIDKMK